MPEIQSKGGRSNELFMEEGEKGWRTTERAKISPTKNDLNSNLGGFRDAQKDSKYQSDPEDNTCT